MERHAIKVFQVWWSALKGTGVQQNSVGRCLKERKSEASKIATGTGTNRTCWRFVQPHECDLRSPTRPASSRRETPRLCHSDILKRMRIVSVLWLQATSVLGYEESNVVSCSLFWYCWPVNATSIFCFYSGFAFNNKQFLWLKRSFHPLYSVNLYRVFLWVNSISWNVLLKIIVNTK